MVFNNHIFYGILIFIFDDNFAKGVVRGVVRTGKGMGMEGRGDSDSNRGFRACDNLNQRLSQN